MDKSRRLRRLPGFTTLSVTSPMLSWVTGALPAVAPTISKAASGFTDPQSGVIFLRCSYLFLFSWGQDILRGHGRGGNPPGRTLSSRKDHLVPVLESDGASGCHLNLAE